MKKELVRIRKAFVYSWDGLVFAWRDAAAFRTEILLTPLVVVFAVYFTKSTTDILIIFGCWLIIFITELINTAIEAVTDLASQGEISLLAKKAKDTASAAVLLSCLIFVVACCSIVIFK